MNKIELESYLNEYVEVTLFDDFVYRGILNKTDDYLERCYKNGYYFLKGDVDNLIFRCSHVKKIKKI
ncbi:hypothetical protein [Parvimonas micra]